MDAERLAYSPSEIGKMLGVSKQTVVNWINKKELTGVKIMGCWLVNKDEVTRIVGLKSDKSQSHDPAEIYYQWFSTLDEKEKLQELNKLLHS